MKPEINEEMFKNNMGAIIDQILNNSSIVAVGKLVIFLQEIKAHLDNVKNLSNEEILEKSEQLSEKIKNMMGEYMSLANQLNPNIKEKL